MQLGTIVFTSGIDYEARKNYKFFCDVLDSLNKYTNKNWGDLCDEDKEANDYALDHGERIVAKYETLKGPIYIITEWDRSVTTILFTDEY